ncbi:hypothetical protein [Variovorax boronicumulans]
MSERYSTTRIPYARALGAPPVMGGTYDGADLARTSARPGAYDALQLPSLHNGRRLDRTIASTSPTNPEPSALPNAA